MVARVALVLVAGCAERGGSRPVVDPDPWTDAGPDDAGTDAGDAGPADPSAAVFTLDRVHEIAIDDLGDVVPGDEAADCRITFDGEDVPEAQAAIAGDLGLGRKASFALGFGERFHDLRGLDVDAPSDVDPSMMRDHVGLELMRRAGIEVPRDGFATVTVDGEPFGLYQIRERIDEEYLERTWGDATGNLYEHPGGGEISLEATRLVTGGGPKGDTSDLELLIGFTEGFPGGAWMMGLGDVVDVDAFFAGWVVETVADVRGGYPYGEGATWLYDVPATRRFVFVPRRVDSAFTHVYFDVDTIPMARIFGRSWGNGDAHDAFVAAQRALLAGPWDAGALVQTLHEAEALVRDAALADPRAEATPEARAADVETIRTFLLGRADVVETMLDAVCGDGTIELGEYCDDGNVEPLDGCDARCEEEYCGDRIVSIGEACDDAGCQADCSGPFECGDGAEDPGEDCDEGDVAEDDGCTSACLFDACGDGIVQPSLGEACDGVGCRPDCSAAGVCGDGVVDVGEDCDDQDADEGDGCSSDCTFGDCATVGDWTYCTAGRSFEDAQWKCRALGLALGLPRSTEDNDVVTADTLARDTGPWWIGADDLRVESAWRDPAGAPVTYLPWGSRQPNGGTDQNCVVIEPERFEGGWNDKACDETHAILCR